MGLTVHLRSEPPFADRHDAGRQLARQLSQYAHRTDVIVLGLPRGGVPVAYEVARALDARLDIFVVRKLGVIAQPELAMGAVASGGVRVLNRDIVRELNISQEQIDAVTAAEAQELQRRERAYRGDRPPLDVAGCAVIIVDDGLATGASMRAAAEALRKLNPARLVVAVPVASMETCERFRHEVDDVICAITPKPFRAVGEWYGDFSQTSDDEVQALLADAPQ
jgi:predicted phosphoribosyltransferase